MATKKANGPEALENIRETIRSKQEELVAIDHVPITKEQAFERIDQYIERANAEIKDRHFKQVSFLNPETRVFELRSDLARLEPLEMEIWLHPENLRDKLRVVVDEHFTMHGTGSGLSDAERLAQKTEIEAALTALYSQEETVFLELKGAGLEPMRRGDEPVEIVYEVVEG